MNPRPKRIAVIDDDPRLAELIREFLIDEGYEVGLCAGGEHALSDIESLRPDAIVLDVRMAGISGLGILYLLSIGEQTRSIPVMLCTASSSHEMEAWETVLDQKGVPVLYKPFSLAELARTIDSLLGTPTRVSHGMDTTDRSSPNGRGLEDELSRW